MCAETKPTATTLPLSWRARKGRQVLGEKKGIVLPAPKRLGIKSRPGMLIKFGGVSNAWEAES